MSDNRPDVRPIYDAVDRAMQDELEKWTYDVPEEFRTALSRAVVKRLQEASSHQGRGGSMTDELTDPRLATSAKTCGRSPEQYEGQLTDGRWFYFRYRWGHASLGVGASVEDAIDSSEHHDARIGGPYDGAFESTEQRDQVFAEPLTAAMEGS